MRPPVKAGGMPRLQEAGLIVVIILLGLLLTSLGGWNLVTADPGVAGLPLRYPKR